MDRTALRGHSSKTTLARTLNADHHVRRYCEILEGAFMVRVLAPWAN
jgi:hypothetical protein